jgi:magnesium-protoporphyrin IX monomethyl ester (oxidative) cyclase
MELDINHPRWKPTLRRLEKAMADGERATKAGGIGGMLGKAWANVRGAAAFISLLTIPSIPSTPPENVRLEPAY